MAPFTDGLEPPGEQLSLISNEEAEAFVLQIDPVILAASENIPDIVAEGEKRRRRSRCSDCGTLHFKEESCPDDTMLDV